MVIKQPTPRVIEIHVHRSKKNPRLGHAVAKLFPCDHNKYLGLTLYKGDKDSNMYRAQAVRILTFEDWDVTDKSICKLCPHDEFWIDDLSTQNNLDDFVDMLEAVDDI